MIDTAKTIWENIATQFNEAGYEFYPPATKTGECKSRYIVCKASGVSPIGSFSSEVHYYTFMLYVPQNQYTELERFKKEVKELINKKLYPLLIDLGSETPDFYDEEVKAHMVSLMYRNSVRNQKL